MTPTLVLDLCAGPGGWSHAARALGLEEVGIELDPTACATRHAAGHRTIRADVAALPVAQLAGRLLGLIASPPCQGMSTAGLRAGWADLDVIPALLADLAAGRDTRSAFAAKISDPRSLLIAEPLRYALAARPAWAACEQVPAVLPLWRETARHLRAAGYSTWSGILDAADYGVPQNRKRAVLIASRLHAVHRPEPAHTQTPAPVLFGECLRPWVSMAEALGWRDVLTVNTRGEHYTSGGNDFTADRPAWTLTKSARTWKLRQSNRANATVRTLDKPAGTLPFGHALNNVAWIGPDGTDNRLTIDQAATLQGFPPDYPFQGTRTKVFEQIGNAVPPPLAQAVLTVAAGRVEVAA